MDGVHVTYLALDSHFFSLRADHLSGCCWRGTYQNEVGEQVAVVHVGLESFDVLVVESEYHELKWEVAVCEPLLLFLL